MNYQLKLLTSIDARWNGAIVGQGGPSNAQLADTWRQLAQKYASQSRIIFGIMNEPHDGNYLNSFPRIAS
jgi:aryl-phospho-beta-D-glucosidase BglC (GH1 family)